MIQNRLTQLFQKSSNPLLTIYFTAGFPTLQDTIKILEYLQEAGADIVEIGIPYSDPIADGETIQQSNQKALENGMTLSTLFEQLQNFRQKISIPVLLMGYLNPVIQFGMNDFLEKCNALGLDGVILPDLPMDEFETEYQASYQKLNISPVFLITPQTSETRIRKIDVLSDGFIYMVSTSSTTGKSEAIQAEQIAYFERIKQLDLKNPTQIGFGISDRASFETATRYANGAIIGSAFIKAIREARDLKTAVFDFVQKIKG